MTDLDVEALSATSGRILPFLSLLIPFWLVRMMVGWRETLAVWPALLVIGGTFAGVQFAWSNFVGFELVDLMSAVASMLAGVIVLRLWRPRTEWRFDHDAEIDRSGSERRTRSTTLTRMRVARAWMPFGLLTLTVLIWGVPPIKAAMDAHTSWKPTIARLHEKVAKGEAVTGHERPGPEDLEKAVVDIVPVSSTGTAVFLAALLSGLFLGVGPGDPGGPPRPHAPPDGPGDGRDLLHAGARVRHQVFRHGRRARAGLHADRPPAVSPLRDDAGLARGRLDRLRHVEQRPVRQPPEDHRAAIWA